jgi:hypothetical protein
MAIDCWNHLDSETLHAACLQAQAALDAAQITANASKAQGELTLWAGIVAAVGALIAGGLAYWGALRTAKLNEDIHKARVATYRFKMRMAVREVLDQATNHLNSANHQVADYEASNAKNTVAFQNTLYVTPSELRPEDWENHATLGFNAVEALHRAMNALSEAYRFGDEMRNNKMANQQSRIPTVTEVANPDGTRTITSDIAVTQNVKVAQELVHALEILRDRIEQ